MPDGLEQWLATRAAIRIPSGIRAPTGPVSGTRDGHEHHIRTTIAERDQAKAHAWLSALSRCRYDAATGTLSILVVAAWNALLFGRTAASPLRTTTAFAKNGREWYALPPDFPRLVVDLLAGADDRSQPVAFRAARAYLDILFLHPFADGNARCAALTLDFILAREGIVPDLLAPVLILPRWADDPLVCVRLWELLESLIEGCQNRKPMRSTIQMRP